VFFCTNYDQEFADLFDHTRPPVEPTLYLCAQEKSHHRTGWAHDEPVFVMVNAPCETPGAPTPDAVWDAVQETALLRARRASLFTEEDTVVWSRTPADLAHRFPGSNGSLYGAASNDTFAAFRRPPNQLHSVPGLFLATGSAHPGGGMPLALRSGVMAADAVGPPTDAAVETP
jgi:1-hydroxycarotenoid 3,4-desaturase